MKQMNFTLTAIGHVTGNLVCLAGVSDDGKWIRLVNIFKLEAPNQRFWNWDYLKSTEVFHDLEIGSQYKVTGEFVSKEQRGSFRHCEDFLPVKIEAAKDHSKITNMYDYLLPFCISGKLYRKYMESHECSLFALHVYNLSWMRVEFNSSSSNYHKPSYMGFKASIKDEDGQCYQNVYRDGFAKDSFKMTDFSFFIQDDKNYLESQENLGECIVVIGFSRWTKTHKHMTPLVVSVIKKGEEK